MKLWVDDIREPDDSWVWARKAQQAIALISRTKFDIISLDHDIENRPDDETFQPVAYFIGAMYQGWQEMSDFKTGFGERKIVVPKIIIHSINPSGAKEMQHILETYGIKSVYEPYDLKSFNKRFGL